MIPNKPGLWWYDMSGVPGALGDRREQVVEVYAVRSRPGLFYCIPGRRGVLQIGEETTGFLAPVLSCSGADELQRHAAALEAQVEDLERELFERAKASCLADDTAAAIMGAMRDE